MQTNVPFGDPKAAKKWSPSLFIDITKKSYFDKKFVADDDGAVIQRLTDLEQDAGDTIHFDLSVQLRNKPTPGDQRLEGKEENLRFYGDDVKIDQLRHGVSCGGKMSRKRTAISIRKTGRDRLSDYWAKYMDELMFIHLTGARGMNEDFTEGAEYVGHAQNPLQAPDAQHIIYGGSATSKATLASTDKLTRQTIEKAAVQARMMRSLDPSTANMMPVMISGEAHYVTIMSLFQEYDLRNADTNGWIDIQKAAAQAEGKANPLFKGGLGMINNVILHSHENVIRFADYGAGANVKAGRALFMGRQAGVIAFGSSGGMRFSWEEAIKDYGNEPTVAAGLIVGVKKTRFNDRDFGVCALDTAAANPNG